MEINDYPDYLIYSDGRVWSNKRGGRFLKPGNSNRYLHVILSVNKKKKIKSVHRLVAEHYIPNPDGKSDVDHINHIRNDNRVENLRWSTHLENCQNKGNYKSNTSGHKYINFHKSLNLWIFRKTINKVRYHKCFKTKTEAIVYKFCFIMKTKRASLVGGGV